VIKLGLSAGAASRCINEGKNLRELAPTAGAAGARVPAGCLADASAGRPVLLESVVDGQPESRLLAGDPSRVDAVVEAVSSWLQRWNAASMTVSSLDRARLERDLLAPARALAAHLPRGQEYVDLLTARCEEAVGRPVPLVAAHNDLTMLNVRFDRSGRLGVIDWEAATRESLPLGDFFYAVTDAVAATEGYADRLGACKACFDPAGRHYRSVASLRRRLETALGISPQLSELCFHACWLHHAANELRATSAAGPRPFLSILAWAAA
jgi:hypothetical protein